jgi:hypothetical protein
MTGEIAVLLASKGDPDDEAIPAVPMQPRAHVPAISGYVVSTAWVAATVAASTSFAKSSAIMRRSMRPS